jgi:hypothetical protein
MLRLITTLHLTFGVGNVPYANGEVVVRTEPGGTLAAGGVPSMRCLFHSARQNVPGEFFPGNVWIQKNEGDDPTGVPQWAREHLLHQRPLHDRSKELEVQ